MINYLPILALFVLAIAFAFGTILLSHLIGPKNSYKEKLSPYECGMPPVGNTRERFPIKFYLIAMLFIIFDIEGVFEPTIELLTLANVQLLRHRITDRKLDEHLERMASLVKTAPKKLSIFHHSTKEIDRQLEEIVRYRMLAIQAFQTVEREIKLIGDWYSARIFDIAARKFKILEWRDSIKEKLEFIEDVYTIVVENFGLSRKDRAEFAQIIFFFILQVGWLALIILEFVYFTR